MMKRIIIFCIVLLIAYLLGVIVINLPQKTQDITEESIITVPTPSTTEPTGSQKPDLNL